MSLTDPSLAVVVRKQIQFKMKSCIGMFSTLIVLQLIALVFSFGGTGMMGGTRSSLEYEMNYYSADIILVFTMLWAFINAILIKTKDYREDDFVFVTNRVSSNLSNIVLLLIVSIVGAITAMLSSYLLRIGIYFFSDNKEIIYTEVEFLELLTGIIAAGLFIFLFSGLGYIIGTLVQLNKTFAFIIPVVFLGFIFLVEMSSEVHLLLEIGKFYFNEESFWLLTSKTIMTSGLLFTAAMLVSNRLEVKQ
ncbi:hypothetical protein [Virgibacillus litoralis]